MPNALRALCRLLMGTELSAHISNRFSVLLAMCGGAALRGDGVVWRFKGDSRGCSRLHERAALRRRGWHPRTDRPGARRIRTDRKRRAIKLPPAWPPIIAQAQINFIEHRLI